MQMCKIKTKTIDLLSLPDILHSYWAANGCAAFSSKVALHQLILHRNQTFNIALTFDDPPPIPHWYKNVDFHITFIHEAILCLYLHGLGCFSSYLCSIVPQALKQWHLVKSDAFVT